MNKQEKFTDQRINTLFYELNDPYLSPDLQDFYGFYQHTKLTPVSKKHIDYANIQAKAGGKCNAYAVIYAISNEQQYRSPLTAKYGAKYSKWPTNVVNECAKENCNAFVAAINKQLAKMRDPIYHDLQATLVNKDFKIIRESGYGTFWVGAYLKISWKK